MNKNKPSQHPEFYDNNKESTSTPEKKSLTDKQKKIIMIASGLAITLTIGGFIGGGLAKNANKENIPNLPVVTEPASPNVTTQPTPEITSVPAVVETTPTPTEAIAEATPTPTPEVTAGTSEVYKQKISMEVMDAMSVEKFAQLPYADRAAYAYTKWPDLHPATPDSAFNPDKVVGFYWQDLTLAAMSGDDINVQSKVISALDYYSYDYLKKRIEVGYQSDIDYLKRIEALDKAAGVNVLITNSYQYIDSGDKQVWIDVNTGKELEYTNITYNVVNGNGNKEPEHTVQVFQMTIKLLDGRTIIAYPQGLGIEGRNSPISANPY